MEIVMGLLIVIKLYQIIDFYRRKKTRIYLASFSRYDVEPEKKVVLPALPVIEILCYIILYAVLT